MYFLLIIIVILAGMGLSVEAGLLSALSQNVGNLWATFSIFSVGTVLTFLLMLFFAPRKVPSLLSQPNWTLTGGILGPMYVVILALITPKIGIAMAMIGVLFGQVAKSLLIDHFGWFGMPRLQVDKKRVVALFFIIIALMLMII
ncbi:transporter family-2 protein [Pasteurella langaaensis DSM 22999]|uniref:Transporter family-2 protein n=1 Tax=Alitibacter langaaensis DSM 22999 TaxID=1122935 RepID=A0A2U0T854_9PAST|nr:DMT family transporter [Pasteurella langaaensis]PVX39806.1 transporter family-2 protein [Pasteurella langaaensis DSM 22999]